LWSVELLASNYEHRVIREGAVKGSADRLFNGLAQVNAADFGTSVRGKRFD
jgi:hypothetical protein